MDKGGFMDTGEFMLQENGQTSDSDSVFTAIRRCNFA